MTLFSLLASSCDCDNIPVSLTEIPNPACTVNINQMARFWFVREGEVKWNKTTPASNTPATISGDLISEAAGWATLFAAADDTKVVRTKKIGGNPTITPGTAITEGGGGNETLNGDIITHGSTPAVVSAEFFKLASETITAMRKLQCEENLEVYIINIEGKIIGKEVAGIQTGIPIKNFFLAEKSNGGLNVSDRNLLTFSLEKGWDENLIFVTPETGFNTLTV